MRIPTIILLTSAVASVAGAQTDWPIYGHDPGGLQYSPLKAIDTRNVSKLRWPGPTIRVRGTCRRPRPLPNPLP